MRTARHKLVEKCQFDVRKIFENAKSRKATSGTIWSLWPVVRDVSARNPLNINRVPNDESGGLTFLLVEKKEVFQ